METRASHLLVGSFVLIFLAALMGFAIWIAKIDPDAKYTDYDIFFTGTVSGLYERGTVYYLGIPVGDVRDISLAEHDQRQVKVHVRLRAEVPVNEGVSARLEFQGLTGVAYIEIEGGPPGGKPLGAQEGQEYPVIPAQSSAFQELFDRAPNLVDEAITAVVQIQKVLSDKNITNLEKILANAESTTSNLAKGTADIDVLIADARGTFARVNQTMESLQEVAQKGGSLIENDASALINEAKQTIVGMNLLVNNLNQLVQANEKPITQFVGGSLPEVSRMIMDLRVTARSLSRLVQKVEEDPSSVIFPAEGNVYDAKTGKKEKKK